jgi:hypothetical protein
MVQKEHSIQGLLLFMKLMEGNLWGQSHFGFIHVLAALS